MDLDQVLNIEINSFNEEASLFLEDIADETYSSVASRILHMESVIRFNSRIILGAGHEYRRDRYIPDIDEELAVCIPNTVLREHRHYFKKAVDIALKSHVGNYLFRRDALPSDSFTNLEYRQMVRITIRRLVDFLRSDKHDMDSLFSFVDYTDNRKCAVYMSKRDDMCCQESVTIGRFRYCDNHRPDRKSTMSRGTAMEIDEGPTMLEDLLGL
jgi:hypothetical protein